MPPDGTLEMDGLWTRTRRGRTELKAIRNAAAGTAAEVIDRAWQLGAQRPQHLVSDGDGAIAAGIELVYGGEAAHQLCAFHLLGVPAEHWGIWFCDGAAVVECGQFGRRSGMGAADYAGDGWGGALLV